MNLYNRRKFIHTTALAAGSIGLAGMVCGCSNGSSKNRKFRYSLCSESVKEFSWEEQCRIIGEAGFDGVEIAPFTLVREGVQEIKPVQRQQMASAMKDAGIVCAGLHWLFVAPPEGLHITTPDVMVRQRSVDYLKEMIDFCGDMGGEVMVFGSPKQRGTSPGVSVADATAYFAEGLSKVADHAKERNVSILIEPLGRSQTDVVNTLSEAVELAKRINHPNIATMFDYHNTEDETEPFVSLVEKFSDHIRHIHVQNMDGTLIRPGQVPQELVNVLQTFKKAGYKKWVSIEVFDFTPGGRVIASEGMKALLEIDSMI